MFKKFIVGLLLVMGVVCFADYKTEVNFNLNDATKIDKFLAEATAAKDEGYIRFWSKIKLIAGKDSKSITYEEFKKLLNFDKWKVNVPQIALQVQRFNPFIKNVINDPEFKNRGYVSKVYLVSSRVLKTLGFKTWKENFINVTSLKKITNINEAKRILNFYKMNSDTLTPTDLKTDCIVFKRAWYANIAISEEWKQLLVKIELMLKSVE